jgi:hypothetical protein
MVLPDPVSIPNRPGIAGSLRTVLSLAVLAPLLLASRLDQVLAGRTISAPLPALLPFLLALLPLLLTFLLALLPLLLAVPLAVLPTLLAAFLPALLAAFPAPVPGTVASGSVTTPASSPAAPSPTAFTGLVEAASIPSAHAFLLFF